MTPEVATDAPWAPQRIGGSDIAKLLGISKYGDASDVYRRIVEGIEGDWSSVMERGAAVEPELRAYGQTMFGLELEDTESDYHDCPRLDFARAQVDDLALWNGLPVVVDYKSCNRFAKGWGREWTDEVPEHIRAQLTWEMLCTGRELGLLIVGFGEDAPPPTIFTVANVIPYQVQRDEEFERYCILVAEDFWKRHVLTRTPPSITKLVKKRRSSK